MARKGRDGVVVGVREAAVCFLGAFGARERKGRVVVAASVAAVSGWCRAGSRAGSGPAPLCWWVPCVGRWYARDDLTCLGVVSAGGRLVLGGGCLALVRVALEALVLQGVLEQAAQGERRREKGVRRAEEASAA